MVRTGNDIVLPENSRNYVIPAWDDYLVATLEQGLINFFEVMTVRSPDGDANTTLTRYELAHTMGLKDVNPESLRWLGSFQADDEKTTHIWLMKLPEATVDSYTGQIQLTLGSEPSTTFCTQILGAEFVTNESIRADGSPDSKRALMLLERYFQALKDQGEILPPYESPTD